MLRSRKNAGKVPLQRRRLDLNKEYIKKFALSIFT